MTWRLAKGLEQLRKQVNEQWPKRSKESDGSVGDTSHGARKSDHNPDALGVVHAIDLTHDPRNGFDSYKFADMLLQRQDPRISYIISNSRIGSGPSGDHPGIWRPYHGANSHDHHVHISITAVRADDVHPWMFDNIVVKPQPTAVPAHPVLRNGSVGVAVKTLQKLLSIREDAIFGRDTEAAVKAEQRHHKLIDDGVVGPQTWKAISNA